MSWSAWLLCGWAVGAVLMAGLMGRKTRMVRKMLREASDPQTDWNGLLESCRATVGLRRAVALKIIPSGSSPAVCGWRHPMILLPAALIENLSTDALRAVLLHELVHVRRRDVWLNSFQVFLQVLYWWHPLVWLANARVRRVREEAVDEAVSAALHPDTETYAAALVAVARMTPARVRFGLGLVGILEPGTALASRIKLLLKRPAPRSSNLGALGLLCICAVGALILPMAKGQVKPRPADGLPSGAPHRPDPEELVHAASQRTAPSDKESTERRVKPVPEDPESRPPMDLRMMMRYGLLPKGFRLVESGTNGFRLVPGTHASAPGVPSLTIDSQVLAAAPTAIADLVEGSIGWTNRSGDRAFVLAAGEVGRAWGRFAQTDALELLSAPRITTPSGQPATLTVQAQSGANEPAQTITLTVTPNAHQDHVALGLEALISEPAVGEGNMAASGAAGLQTFSTEFSLKTHAAVQDGGCLVLVPRRNASAKDERALVLLVTPRIEKK